MKWCFAITTLCHWWVFCASTPTTGFILPSRSIITHTRQTLSLQAKRKDWESEGTDSSTWVSAFGSNADTWREDIAKRQREDFWTSFEPSEEGDENTKKNKEEVEMVDEAEVWLDTLAKLQAEEVAFNQRENDRADTVRKMQEWGFDQKTIANALDVATDDSLETKDELKGMKSYRETSYLDDIDWKKVESHAKVEKDPETGEPVRTQMVYVDEHTCIGCTNCAMVAQSTFFMDDEHGRARVFQQWGDTDETIQVAIETCPVDCIHYVPYDELVKLEVERRDQNINFKARLVSQAEIGNSLSHRVGGPNTFSAPQKISGNMAARCNNCPSRGCKNCPMYGVGKNPEFERKEKLRKTKIEKNKIQQRRVEEAKRADL